MPPPTVLYKNSVLVQLYKAPETHCNVSVQKIPTNSKRRPVLTRQLGSSNGVTGSSTAQTFSVSVFEIVKLFGYHWGKRFKLIANLSRDFDLKLNQQNNTSHSLMANIEVSVSSVT